MISNFDPILVPTRVHFENQNPPKNRFQGASKNRSIWGWIFWSSWLHFGTQVGIMLATFLVKLGGPKLTPPILLLGLCYFSFFSPSWPRGGWVPHRTASILGGFWLHVGTILALCWALWAQELALDGLLREASRIFLSLMKWPVWKLWLMPGLVIEQFFPIFPKIR